MLPTRFVPMQPSGIRKSRLEGKPSLLPKPRRPGSTDRLSTEPRRPSAAGHRSSSAEPSRGTFAGGRLSREASATKLPTNARSRSQQPDRYAQSSMTPLRSSQFSRPTTTPVRTPSEDRATRSWQTSLDRALAFVTVKDQRPLSSNAWQRAECARAAEALGGALMRPLTIARFVDVANALISAITRDARLNTDNYVTKLPHLSKRLLYPGTVSKSWLKTVNTLHAFPHALALIAYLLDIVNHIETPVSVESLYIGKDDLSCLRRDYLNKCWIRFQDTDHEFTDLNEEYLQSLKALLGNDDEKIGELTHLIKQYEASLEDEAELAARAAEARRAERREALLSGLRQMRAQRRADRSAADAQDALRRDCLEAIQQLDHEIERASAESQQLKHEVETQPLTVEQRTKLLDEVDYALRVQDSKRSLAEQIAKMVLTKETELALWQKKSLDSCVEYKQGLIHLSAQFPDLASLAIDEKELMGAECAQWVSGALGALRAVAAELSERRAGHARERTALARQRAALLEETRTKIAEMKNSVQREQQNLDSENSKEAAEASSWTAELRELTEKLEALRTQQHEYARADAELDFWEKQEAGWRSKLLKLQDYIRVQRDEAQRVLEAAKAKRAQLIIGHVRAWNEKLAQ